MSYFDTSDGYVPSLDPEERRINPACGCPYLGRGLGPSRITDHRSTCAVYRERYGSDGSRIDDPDPVDGFPVIS